MPIQPVAAINEWSCALACVQARLNGYGNPITQKDMLRVYTPFFSKWQNQPGVLSRIEIPYLLELLGYHFRTVLFTSDKDCFLNLFSEQHQANNYWDVFLLLHQPTNHCNAILTVNAQELEVMEPAQNGPHLAKKSFVDLAKSDPEYLLLCK